MDFKIETDGLSGQMTFDKADNIMNNVFLSLAIPQGAFFQNPAFGSRLHLLPQGKLTARTVKLAEEYATEALQWLLDIGRAISIEPQAEIDPHNKNRLNLQVDITQADGREISFDTFVEVV